MALIVGLPFVLSTFSRGYYPRPAASGLTLAETQVTVGVCVVWRLVLLGSGRVYLVAL